MMRLLRTGFLPPALLVFFVYSCQKNNGGTPIPPPHLDSMNIRLSVPGAYPNEEVIISEAGGKILLDTLSPFKEALSATLRTNQTLLDFTLVYFDSINVQFQVVTYKGINISAWSALYQNNYRVPIGPVATRSATIYYQNMPLVSLYGLLVDDFGGGSYEGWSTPAPGILSLDYTQHGTGNYMYLLLPEPGLYNFHIPKGITDTVDLSMMDTAIQVTFNKPASFNIQPTLLIGYMDTLDYTKSVMLYGAFPGPATPDVEYPKKGVQKLELFVTATNNNKGNAWFYSYADTIPTTMPFPDESFYTLSSTVNTNFKVAFTKGKPTYYITGWKNTKLFWVINASPDSTGFNPEGILGAFKSKLLQGQDLSGLVLSAFNFETTLGMDYAGFTSYEHSPALSKSKRVTSSVGFSKSY